MPPIEFWIIYSHNTQGLGLENYYNRNTGFGPMFGACFESTPRFTSKMDALEVARSFPMMVLFSLQHVGLVSPEETTCKPWVMAWHVNKTVEAIRKRPDGDYLMGGPEGPRSPEDETQSKHFYDRITKLHSKESHEAQEEADRERTPVREPEPGEGVQLDPRGQEPQEVEAAYCSGGKASGRGGSEVPPQEAVPGAEGGDDGRVGADSILAYEDKRFLAETDKLIGHWELHLVPVDETKFLPGVSGPAADEAVEQLEARQWLIDNDHEAAEFWKNQPDGTDFIGAKRQDLRDFGKEPNAIDETKFLSPIQIIDGGDGVVKVGLVTQGACAGVVTMAKSVYDDVMDDAGEPEHTQDPDGDWPRVGGDVVCDQCGKTFYKHPLDGPKGYDGQFLNRLCSGQLVKL